MRVGTTVLSLLLWGLGTLPSMAGEFRGNTEGLLVVSAVLGAAIWFVLKIGHWRYLELHEDRIVLRDHLTRTVVPVDRVRGVGVSGGSLALELADGRWLPSAAFEGSLWATLFGSRSANRARRVISDFYGFGENGQAPEDAPVELERGPHLNLLALPVVIAIAFTGYFLLGLVFSP
jgi:hypothetical protein